MVQTSENVLKNRNPFLYHEFLTRTEIVCTRLFVAFLLMTVSTGNVYPPKNGENKFCRHRVTRVSKKSVYGTSHGSFGINQIQTIQTATFGRFSSIFDRIYFPRFLEGMTFPWKRSYLLSTSLSFSLQL